MRHKVYLSQDWNFLRPINVTDLIRVGKDNDGGYILPKYHLMSCTQMISGGIAYDWSFENKCIEINQNLKILAWDGTTCEEHMLPDVRRAFHHTFNPPNMFISRHLDPETMQFWLSQHTNWMIKLDIEGNEYEFIDTIVNHASQIRLLVIEFHELCADITRFFRCAETLSRFFRCCHLHANNGSKVCHGKIPDVIEITWINSNFTPARVDRRSQIYLPHLDQPNCRDVPDIELSYHD